MWHFRKPLSQLLAGDTRAVWMQSTGFVLSTHRKGQRLHDLSLTKVSAASCSCRRGTTAADKWLRTNRGHPGL